MNEFAMMFADHEVDKRVKLSIGSKRGLPVMLNSSPGARVLIVAFHGAFERSRNELPKFLDRQNIGVEAHRISIADPALERSDRLALGWFAGDDGFPLQQLLPAYLKSLIEKLSIERVIFMGSSAGGFASLFYSWHIPGSVAVVKNPQTSILAYRRSAHDRYVRACWPRGVENYGSIGPELDLTELYSKRVDNTVIYIQNTLDFHHLYNHMVPFLASIPSDFTEQVVVKTSYWGRAGHSDSVPLREWDAWAKAATLAESPTSTDITNSYLHLDLEKGPKLGEFRKKPTKKIASKSLSNEPSAEDIEWAKMVSHIQTLEEK